jgi:hypothetical protein
MTKRRPSQIPPLSGSTRTTLSIAGTVVLSAIGCVLWIQNAIKEGASGTNGRLDLIEYRLSAIEKGEEKYVPSTVFRAFARDLKTHNPLMVVPSVE